MSNPDGANDNGWERWRGEVSAKLDQLLEGRCLEREAYKALRAEHDSLEADHQATRGLAWRGIFIAIGAWSAIAVIATWLWEHVAK